MATLTCGKDESSTSKFTVGSNKYEITHRMEAPPCRFATWIANDGKAWGIIVLMLNFYTLWNEYIPMSSLKLSQEATRAASTSPILLWLGWSGQCGVWSRNKPNDIKLCGQKRIKHIIISINMLKHHHWQMVTEVDHTANDRWQHTLSSWNGTGWRTYGACGSWFWLRVKNVS